MDPKDSIIIRAYIQALVTDLASDIAAHFSRHGILIFGKSPIKCLELTIAVDWNINIS